MSDDADLVKEGREAFARAESAESDNRATYLADLKFARDGVQWPADIAKQRAQDRRPMLTLNKMPAFMRQVVNDARQNKPSIKVHPVDDSADVETAEVINGLIRNIEYTSNADVAYDTATECAVSGGFGYLRVTADYSYEDGFDMDLAIQRIANPLSVYGDPYSSEADSCDWNDAHVVDQISQDEFKRKYKDAAQVDWSSAAWTEVSSSWMNVDAKMVTVAEWWKRREVEKKIVQLSDGTVVDEADLESTDMQVALQAGLVQVKNQRTAKCHEVTQYIMSGAEILATNKWPGKYIPIIPVYGDEYNIEGKRYLRSLIYPARDAQIMYNVWRTTAVELLGLAPRVPFIGKKGTFNTDQDRWQTANVASHAYLEYDGEPPIRLPLDSGPAAGALQEALNASDDMKAIIGLYDPSLGAKSNETSGVAIKARQREGDVSTFHFVDNMARAIRHTGRILIDLIPHYYNTERTIRIIGEDGKQEPKPINQQFQQPVMGPDGQPVMEQGPDGNPVQKVMIAMHDLRVGKYDLVVETGPSYTTKREEAVVGMTAALQAFPDAAPVILPELAKNSDWPGADKLAEKLQAMQQPQIPPEMQQQMDQAAQQVDQLTQENQQLKMDQSAEMAKIEAQKQADMVKATNDRAIAEQKLRDDFAIQQQKLSNDKQLAEQQAASDRNLGFTKATNDRDIAAMKHDGKQQTGADGKTSVKSGTDIMVQGLTELGRLIADSQKATQQSLEQIARVIAAPNELVRDPKTNKPVGSRKVLQ